jgi:hypothetical protein
VAELNSSRARLFFFSAFRQGCVPQALSTWQQVNDIFPHFKSSQNRSVWIITQPNDIFFFFISEAPCPYLADRVLLHRLSPEMEYQPLCCERDEIRVISIEPSKIYSGGRGDTNLWASSITFQRKEYECVPAVRIALSEDMVHYKLENVSLQDTVDR